ncbi:hypothetical protein K7432_001600 [Basidiobolus ranarum]|uniref:SEC7 domain-containing protein n=1 Tax=Basidiobolus ranarum TaxID=34480 RepID=A0ABR2X2U9_9FUNG
MEDSILPPSLPNFSPNNPTSADNGSSKDSSLGGRDLSIQTSGIDHSIFNSVPANFGFLEVGDRSKESPVSPTSNRLKRAAAIRVHKVPSNGLRKGAIDKQEQRKERNKLLRRSLSLNDSEAISEHVSIPLDQEHQNPLTEEITHRRRQLRKSKSFSEERNSALSIERSTHEAVQLERYEEEDLFILDDQEAFTDSPIKTNKDLEDGLHAHNANGDNSDVDTEIPVTKRPLARRSRSFNVVSNSPSKNAELLRTYSSHNRREKEPIPVYSEGPLGFWSQKFNATKEPKRDRISGIMKSWKVEDDSETTFVPLFDCIASDGSASNENLTLLSSVPRKLSAGAIKFHKPKVSKIVIQNPSESRALFEPAVPEKLVSDSSLRNDEYQGLFLPSKEIKANRVQFNTRSSLEMRLTKEKLCSVIVEDIAEQRLELESALHDTPPEIVYPNEDEGNLSSQTRKNFNQGTDYQASPVPTLSPFLNTSRKNSLQTIDQDEHSPSPLSPADIGPSFFLTALTDRLKLPFALDGQDLSVSPRSTGPLPNNTLSQDNVKNASGSPILKTCSIPVFSTEYSENDSTKKRTPTTPNDDIPVDTSIKIACEDSRPSNDYSSLSCTTQPKIEPVPNIRTNASFVKRFSVVESAGVVKGILPHLKKKKPSILTQSSSFRRNSRRIAPQLLHIDTNVSRRSLVQHQKTASTETVSSSESITPYFANQSDETGCTHSTHEATESTSSSPASNSDHNYDMSKLSEAIDADISGITTQARDSNVTQNLCPELQSSTKAAANFEQVTKSTEVATKKPVKNMKIISRSTNQVKEEGCDSSVEPSTEKTPSALNSQSISDDKPKVSNKAKDAENKYSHDTRDVVYQGLALQIINSNAVKNRYLILMDDLLVIAKPISREGSQSYTLNSRFMVKHIIDLSSISFSVSREKERNGRKGIEDGKAVSSSRNQTGELHPLIASTVRRFNINPYEGIMYMIDKGALRADPLSISTFLHKTPELSRKQIGKFLGMQSNHAILNSFLDRCKFSGLRIDDALRVFLASFRLPGEGNIIDYLVGAFARRWHRANAHYVSFDVEISIKLAFFMMALNADLHNRKCPTKIKMELADFVERFRAMDTTSAISENLLVEIYHSIRQDKLETAMDDREYQAITIETRFPSDYHLVIDDSSALLTVTIPVADRDLRIKPVGDGLVCDVPVLDFTYTNTHTFTVKSTSLGRKSLQFIKLGARSRKYTSISAWSLVVEPPFMQHTFQVGFPGETSAHPRKKFMFGVESATERTTWLEKITTTFAKTFNHTNSELEMIIGRLKNHLIAEDSTRSLILSGHELVQCLQAPITSTTSPELRTSTNMKHPTKTSSKTTASSFSRPQPSSNKLRSNLPASQSSHNRTRPPSIASRGRNPPLNGLHLVHSKGPRRSQYAAGSNISSSRPNNYPNDPNSTTMTTGGAKFRIRAG